MEDLEGAARAVMRLQDVYSLSVKGLARGRFQSISKAQLPDIYSPGQAFSLSADDCFHIGKVSGGWPCQECMDGVGSGAGLLAPNPCAHPCKPQNQGCGDPGHITPGSTSWVNLPDLRPEP